MKMCHPVIGHLPPNHDVGRVTASLHPRNVFLHLTGRLITNLLVLVVVLLLDGRSHPWRGCFCACSFLACYWRRCYALVHQIIFKEWVRMCPFEQQCTLMCWSSLMRRDIDWVDMFSSRDMIFCFQSRFWRIRSRTVLIAAWTLKLFRRPDWALSSTLQSSS